MTRSTYAAAISVAVILFFCLASVARAAVPAGLNYQGYLTDATGAAIDGNVDVTFSIYTTDVGGTALWTDDVPVVVDQGLFSVELGAGGSFPPGMFSTPLYLGVTIAGDTEMLPRRPLTTVGFAFKADDTLSLQGQGPAAFDQSAHLADMANPHNVTAVQSGAASASDIAGLQSQLDAALTVIGQLQSDLSSEISNRIADVNAEEAARIADVNAEEAARIADVDGEQAAREAADAIHTAAITDIQINSVLALDGILSFEGGNTALFTGVNVQVVNGTGFTDLPTGTGNLIVGYNAPSTFGSSICSLGAYTESTPCVDNGGVWAVSHKSGSHNVVVGDNHNYSRYAGLVAGNDNNITGDFSSVTGGIENTASGTFSSVTGGSYNRASGNGASVSGGAYNTANDGAASVSGGENNVASGNKSSVSGGEDNTADADGASVSGGQNNSALENWSSISGGYENFTTGEYASISGGIENTASGEAASVSNGRNKSVTADYTVYQPGDTGPAGGLVFYVNDSGTHGLEAAPADAGSGVWGCSATEITGADGEVIGYGAQNTLDILTECTVPDIASDIARDYSLNGFNDWFLPSKDELNLMHLNLQRVGLGGFANVSYWSSSELSINSALSQHFGSGTQLELNKGFAWRVRATRAF